MELSDGNLQPAKVTGNPRDAHAGSYSPDYSDVINRETQLQLAPNGVSSVCAQIGLGWHS